MFNYALSFCSFSLNSNIVDEMQGTFAVKSAGEEDDRRMIVGCQISVASESLSFSSDIERLSSSLKRLVNGDYFRGRCYLRAFKLQFGLSVPVSGTLYCR